MILKDFATNDQNNPISKQEFEDFTGEIAQDLYTHDIDWPGFAGGRAAYDTPFYNGGQSVHRTRDPDSEEGQYPSDQQVCIESMGCSDRSNINYIAQGMWGAASREPYSVSVAICEWWVLNEDIDWLHRVSHILYQLPSLLYGK